jgi:predicted aminopeptidase
MQNLSRRLCRILPLLVVAITTACSPLYVIRAGWHEARILSRRRPIARVIEDPATAPAVRHKLELVLQARSYAERSLDLAAGDSYTTYSWVDRDTLLMVITASQPDRFQAHTWWFPVVGRVPYKGYFDFDKAYDAAAKLREDGLDTYVRPSGAFSTLGWFNDPLLSTILRYGDVSLAATVVHEILHNTVYIPSQVAFNESFASFVGDRGAIDFFCTRDGEASSTCDLAKRNWHDTLVYGAFLSDLVHRLEAVYGRTDLTREAKLAQKAELLATAKARFRTAVEPQLQTTGYRGFLDQDVNNATLIGVRLYYERLDVFERVFQRYGGDLALATRSMIAAAKASPGDPYGAMEKLVQSGPPQ